jgi:hypothetical protein
VSTPFVAASQLFGATTEQNDLVGRLPPDQPPVIEFTKMGQLREWCVSDTRCTSRGPRLRATAGTLDEKIAIGTARQMYVPFLAVRARPLLPPPLALGPIALAHQPLTRLRVARSKWGQQSSDAPHGD